MNSLRWDLIVTVLGFAMMLAALTPVGGEFLSGMGFVVAISGVGMSQNRRRKLAKVPPPPVPASASER